LTGAAFTGVAFVGVAFAVVDDAALVVLFTGPALVVLLIALSGLDVALLVTGFFLTGSGFVVPRGVRVRAGFEASLMDVLVAVTGVFFAVVVVDTGLLAVAVAAGFLTGVDVEADATFAVPGAEADTPVPLSFLGTLFADVAAAPTPSVDAATGFLTGVALAADVVVFATLAVTGFFAVEPAILETFPMLDCSAAFCCLSWSTADMSTKVYCYPYNLDAKLQ